MLQLWGRLLRNGLASAQPATLHVKRCISLTGAIESGIRKSQQTTIRRERQYAIPPVETIRHDDQITDHTADDTYEEEGEEEGEDVDATTQERPKGRKRRKGPRTAQPFQAGKHGRSAAAGSGPPVAIPYTTAGSEFLYGTFSVHAALNARRRKFYKLYRLLSVAESKGAVKAKKSRVYSPKKTPEEAEFGRKIERLAGEVGLTVEPVSGPRWHGIFAKASDGRPHNNWMLEASPIPQLPTTSLFSLSRPSDDIAVEVGWASEEERVVNTVFGASSSNKAIIPSPRPPHRYPFMLLLDCVTDTGNFGAIVRSAWFLGVDAILMLEHGTAPVAGNSVKTSAGALEYMPVLHIKNEREFLRDSRRNGWKFFAADAPGPSGEILSRVVRGKGRKTLGLEGSLLRHPCVLVLGNEETGIRDFMRTLMDGVAAIPNARPHVEDIDSLNVGVAAALITQKFFDTAPPPAASEESQDSPPIQNN